MSFSLTGENGSLGLMEIEVLHLLEKLAGTEEVDPYICKHTGFLSVFMACEILDHT